MIGAYLIIGGPSAASAFMQWLDLPLVCSEACITSSLSSSSSALLGTSSWKLYPSHDWTWPYHHATNCQCWTSQALAYASKVFPPAHPSPPPGLIDSLGLKRLETLLGYTFVNRWFLIEALTHPSYSAKHYYPQQQQQKGETGGRVVRDYQRLEFLGRYVGYSWWWW